MNKNKESYIEAFKNVYFKKYNSIYTNVSNGRKILFIFNELNKRLPLKEQKKIIDRIVAFELGWIENIRLYLTQKTNYTYFKTEPKTFMEKLTDDSMEYKGGNVYAFKYKEEKFYRFFVIIKEKEEKNALGYFPSGHMHVLKYTSDKPHINISKVGWDDVLTKFSIAISRYEFEREYIKDKEEKYYKLVAQDVEIDKEELNFLEFKETDEDTNVDTCLNIYNKEFKGKHILTAHPVYFGCTLIRKYIDIYELYAKYIDSNLLELFRYDNEFENYLEREPKEVKEVPAKMMQLVEATDIPISEAKYKSIRVKKVGEEYTYFNQLDNYLLELGSEIEKINSDILGDEGMTGENYEVLIRYYLEEVGYDLKGINSDSDADIISFISEDEK